MKLTATMLALVSLTVPSHAAAPRNCRIANFSRAGRVRVVATSHTANHHAAKSNLVITAFAVPVAVPVAPFASHWYGVNEYHEISSLRGSASGARHTRLRLAKQATTLLATRQSLKAVRSQAEPGNESAPSWLRSAQHATVALRRSKVSR